MGLISIEDPETGSRIEAPTGFDSFREEWSRWHNERSDLWAAQCRRCGAAHLELSAAADPTPELLRFFGSRHARERI